MTKNRWKYVASSASIGLIFMGLGWGLSNFYLLVIGAVVLASSLTWLTLPMPTIF